LAVSGLDFALLQIIIPGFPEICPVVLCEFNISARLFNVLRGLVVDGLQQPFAPVPHRFVTKPTDDEKNKTKKREIEMNRGRRD